MNYIFNEEGERIAGELIEKYHPHLRGVKIAYLFKAKPMEVAVEEHTPVDAPRPKPRKAKKATHRWIAKCSLVSGKYRLLFTDDFKFIITADQEIWDELTEAQRVAVMDHELEHAKFDDDGKPRLKRHDIQDFRSTVERHGLYMNDVRAFYEACERGKERAGNVNG